MPTIGKFVIGNVGTLQSASNIYIDPVAENFTYIQATSSNVAMALKDLDERFESIGTPPSLTGNNTFSGKLTASNGINVSNYLLATNDVVTVSAKLTASNGLLVTGDVSFDDATFTGNVTLGNDANDVVTIPAEITASSGMLIPDDKGLYFGTDKDVTIQYNSYLDFLWVDGTDVRISDDKKLTFGTNGDAFIEYDENGTDELRFSGASARFEQAVAFEGKLTASNGLEISNHITADNGVVTVPAEFTASLGVLIPDNKKLYFGSDEDVSIRYDELGSDELKFTGAAAKFEQVLTASNGFSLSGGSFTMTKHRLDWDSNLGHSTDSVLIFDVSDSDAAKTITVDELSTLLGGAGLADSNTWTNTNIFSGQLTASNGLSVNDRIDIYNTDSDPVGDGLGDATNYHLQIEGNSANDSSMGIAFGSSNNVGAAILHIDKGSYSQGDLSFYTKPTAGNGDLPSERMRIQYDGNIGMGTAAPMVPLDIYEMGGLLLGYTKLNNGNAASNYSYAMTTSMTVPNSNWYVTFTAPASGKVEIQFSGFVASAASSATKIYLGLSSASSWSSIGNEYIREVWETDDGDNVTVEHSWVLTGLTPGSSQTIYVGTKAGAGSVQYWRYGGSNANLYKDLTIKAMALPNTIVTD
jgi:hypothetical protein